VRNARRFQKEAGKRPEECGKVIEEIGNDTKRRQEELRGGRLPGETEDTREAADGEPPAAGGPVNSFV
jgi:hypothetical protein